MEEKTWVLRARRDRGVLTVGALGIATSEGLRTLRAFVRAAMGEHDDAAVLVDLRGVGFDLSTEDWAQAAKDSARAGFKPPIALVVQQRHFDFAVTYCLKAAEAGQLRMAFTDLERASCWARQLVDPETVPGALEPPLRAPQRVPRLRLVR